MEALRRQLLEGGDAAEAARGEAEAQLRRQRAALEAEAQLRRQAEFADVNAQVGGLGCEGKCAGQVTSCYVHTIPLQQAASVWLMYRHSACRSVCSCWP